MNEHPATLLRCVVERITYQNPENGYSVLKVKVKGYNDLVTLVGNLLEVPVGSVQSSTAAHAWQQPKRIPEITVFTTAGTADVNIACCITNVYHFSSFHDIKF